MLVVLLLVVLLQERFGIASIVLVVLTTSLSASSDVVLLLLLLCCSLYSSLSGVDAALSATDVGGASVNGAVFAYVGIASITLVVLTTSLSASSRCRFASATLCAARCILHYLVLLLLFVVVVFC